MSLKINNTIVANNKPNTFISQVGNRSGLVTTVVITGSGSTQVYYDTSVEGTITFTKT